MILHNLKLNKTKAKIPDSAPPLHPAIIYLGLNLFQPQSPVLSVAGTRVSPIAQDKHLRSLLTPLSHTSCIQMVLKPFLLHLQSRTASALPCYPSAPTAGHASTTPPLGYPNSLLSGPPAPSCHQLC